MLHAVATGVCGDTGDTGRGWVSGRNGRHRGYGNSVLIHTVHGGVSGGDYSDQSWFLEPQGIAGIGEVSLDAGEGFSGGPPVRTRWSLCITLMGLHNDVAPGGTHCLWTVRPQDGRGIAG